MTVSANIECVRFRWVELQIQFICSLKTSALVEKRLGTLPRRLSQIYEDLYSTNFDQFDEEEKTLSEYIFRLLLCCPKTMSSAHFVETISRSSGDISLSKAIILQLTFNLVIYDMELDVFRFAHLSVREYLEGKDFYVGKLNRRLVVKACLSALMDEHALGNSIFDHTRRYWALHIWKFEDMPEEVELGPLLLAYLKNMEQTPIPNANEALGWH